MPPALSRPIPWGELEKKSPEEQKQFLAQYEGKSDDEQKDIFRRESVSSDLENVKKGDHLVHKGSTYFFVGYEHHLLCTKVKYSDEKGCKVVKVVEYTTDLWPSANPTGYLRSSGSADLTGLGKIKENTYTYEELKEKGVEKVIWPNKLERFDSNEVIRRAERRSKKKESYYDVLKNNCEHFVCWCKCGLNVSLQVKSWYTWARECLYSLVAGAKECISQKAAEKLVPLLIDVLVAGKKYMPQKNIENLVSLLIGVLGNVSDELVWLLSKKYAAAFAGFCFGILLETGVGFYEIKKARDQRSKGLIKSDELLKAKIVEIVAKGVGRSSLGIIGSVIGTAVGGPLGSFVGGAIGGAAGHLLGFGIGWWYENRQYLDG